MRLRLSLLFTLLTLTSCVDELLSHSPPLPPGVSALRVLGCDLGLRVEFSEDLDASSVTNESFYVENTTGTVSYDAAGRTATFLPLDPFVSGESYTAVLTEELSSASGSPLSESIRWQFVCVDRSAPLILERAPLGEEISPHVTPSIRFSEPLDEATLSAENVRILGVETTLEWELRTRTLRLVPVRTLYPGRSYTVVISAKVRDLTGNALGTDVSWTFRTRAPMDDWALRLVSPPIVDAAACDAVIELRVAPHVEMDPQRLEPSAVTVDGVVGSTVSWHEEERILRVVPDAPLRPGGVYPLLAGPTLTDRFGVRFFDENAQIARIRGVDDCAIPTLRQVPEAWSKVACDGALRLGFSVPMELDSLPPLLSLRDLVHGEWAAGEASDLEMSVEADESGRLLTLSPLEPLVHARRYRLELRAGALSQSALQMPQGGSWEMQADCE